MTETRPNGSLLSLADLSAPELEGLLRLARRLKEGGAGRPLEGRVAALLFDAPSTRTRLSFAAAAARLGATPVVLSPSDLHLGRGESVADTARAISAYADAVVLRTTDEAAFAEFAAASRAPVINGLTPREHPCQTIADLLTLAECFPTPLAERRVAWLGACNNMSRGWTRAAGLLGFRLRLAHPGGAAALDADSRALLEAARAAGADVEATADPAAAAAGADAVATDAWASLGEADGEAEARARRAALEPLRVDARLMARAAPDAVLLHCLPAHRGEEVTSEALDGPQSRVWQEAANRLPAQQAILLRALGLEGAAGP